MIPYVLSEDPIIEKVADDVLEPVAPEQATRRSRGRRVADCAAGHAETVTPERNALQGL